MDQLQLPHDLPLEEAIYQKTQQWLKADCFKAIVQDLRTVLRTAQGRDSQPTAAIFDGRTLQFSCESGSRAGYDGHKHRYGSKIHMADTLGHLLALLVMPANAQEREQVAPLAKAVQEVTEQNIEIALVDQGYTAKDRPKLRSSRGCGWRW